MKSFLDFMKKHLKAIPWAMFVSLYVFVLLIDYHRSWFAVLILIFVIYPLISLLNVCIMIWCQENL